jgi:hypothetical protein
MTPVRSTSSRDQGRVIFMNLSVQSSSRFNGRLTASLRAHRRGVSPQYVNRRIVVGMGFETAMSAAEDRLALATSAVNGSAFRTRLARVGGRDFNQRPAALFKFVGKDGLERVPALIENRSVKTGLCADAAPWGLNRSGRARGHVGDLQVLHDDRSKPARDIQCGTVMPVPADTSALGRQAGAPAELLQSSLGAFLATRKDALSAPVLTVYRREGGRDGQMLAIRKCEGISHASVNADAWKIGDGRNMVDFASEADMPAKWIKCNRCIPNLALGGACTSEFDPANLRDSHSRPLSIELLYASFDALEAEAIVLAFSAWPRVRAASREKILIRPIQIAKGLVLAGGVNRRYPSILGAQLCQFATLRSKANVLSIGAKILSPKVTPLLKPQVVNQPTNTCELLEQYLLFGRRSELVAESTENHWGKSYHICFASQIGAQP